MPRILLSILYEEPDTTRRYSMDGMLMGPMDFSAELAICQCCGLCDLKTFIIPVVLKMLKLESVSVPRASKVCDDNMQVCQSDFSTYILWTSEYNLKHL